MEERNRMNRRDFLKTLGALGATTAMASLSSCDDKNASRSGLSADSGKMTYRTTPSTGDKVSLLGYGCMRWPTIGGGRNADFDQEQINRMVDYAIEHGVNYFDTSPNYGRGLSERVTGIALSRHPRESYYIATKLSNFSPQSQTREGAMAMYHNSFKELQVDYIDYMLLHGVGMGGMRSLNERYIDNGILEFLQQEKQAGRIRNLGFSFHGEVRVFDHLLEMHDKGEAKWDFVQIQMNYVDWKHAKVNSRNVDAEYLYNELDKRHIPVVIMEPILGGRLSRVPNYLLNKMKERDPESTAASWAFRYVGSFPNVLTVLSGMTFMEHLEENVRTYSSLQPLKDSDYLFLEDIAQLMLRFPIIQCNSCQYCMPCPYGLDIPSIFEHYNKCLNESNVPTNSQSENYRKARRAFLIGYDRSVPKLRQADHCVGCEQCNPHCPQNINIPKELLRIDQYVEQLKQETL